MTKTGIDWFPVHLELPHQNLIYIILGTDVLWSLTSTLIIWSFRAMIEQINGPCEILHQHEDHTRSFYHILEITKKF
jgi:hypothetical protein